MQLVAKIFCCVGSWILKSSSITPSVFLICWSDARERSAYFPCRWQLLFLRLHQYTLSSFATKYWPQPQSSVEVRCQYLNRRQLKKDHKIITNVDAKRELKYLVNRRLHYPHPVRHPPASFVFVSRACGNVVLNFSHYAPLFGKLQLQNILNLLKCPMTILNNFTNCPIVYETLYCAILFYNL